MDALRKHLATPVRGWWIEAVHRDGTTVVAGPFPEVRARQRARYLFQFQPGLASCEAVAEPRLPVIQDWARWVVLATRRTDGVRLVCGPFTTRKGAIARTGLIINAAPDSQIEDYDLTPHYEHDPAAYKRTRASAPNILGGGRW
jgi:hypothetical protein